MCHKIQIYFTDGIDVTLNEYKSHFNLGSSICWTGSNICSDTLADLMYSNVCRVILQNC